MSLPSPSPRILSRPPDPENGYGHRGPQSRQEIEEASPVGRALHWLEDVAYGGSDAAANEGDGRVISMHRAFQRIAGFVERSCGAIRQGATV